jgi:Ca-activated chloride channel family protein
VPRGRGRARAGRGAAEFIAPGERLEPKVLRQFRRLLSPALSDVRIDWGGLGVTPAPATPPPVFAGDRLIAYGILADARPATVTLSARRAGAPVAFTMALDPGHATAGTTVATLAARTLIRELEEGAEGLSRFGSRQTARRRTRVSDEIVRLATTYGLASRETSLVAIERRETPVQGEMLLRRIPVALTNGWGALEDAARGPALHAQSWLTGQRFRMVSAVATSTVAPRLTRIEAAGFAGMSCALGGDVPFAAVSELSRLGSAAAGPQHPLDRLVTLQLADGSWELTPELAAVLRIELGEIDARRPTGGAPDGRRVWATLLALAWLERRAAGARDEWALLARKAERWLARAVSDRRKVSAWTRAAEALVEMADAVPD